MKRLGLAFALVALLACVRVPFLVLGAEHLETRPDGNWLVVTNPPLPCVLEHSKDLVTWETVAVWHVLKPGGKLEIQLGEGDKEFWRVRPP